MDDPLAEPLDFGFDDEMILSLLGGEEGLVSESSLPPMMEPFITPASHTKVETPPPPVAPHAPAPTSVMPSGRAPPRFPPYHSVLGACVAQPSVENCILLGRQLSQIYTEKKNTS